MASHRTDPPNELTLDDFPAGAAVQVHAFGYWYAGEVLAHGRVNVRVRFTTGSGAVREKNVAPGSGLLRRRAA